MKNCRIVHLKLMNCVVCECISKGLFLFFRKVPRHRNADEKGVIAKEEMPGTYLSCNPNYHWCSFYMRIQLSNHWCPWRLTLPRSMFAQHTSFQINVLKLTDAAWMTNFKGHWPLFCKLHDWELGGCPSGKVRHRKTGSHKHRKYPWLGCITKFQDKT